MGTFLLYILSFTIAACNALYVVEPENKGSSHWALLVAGSKGWENYRHQENRILAKIDDASLDVLNVYQLQNPHEHTTFLNKPEPNVGGCKAEQDSINVKPGKEKDEFDTFGEHVATSIRNIQGKHKQAIAKFQINNLLYKTEMEQYNQPSKHLNKILSSSSSTSSTTENLPLANRVEDKISDTIVEDAFMT